VTRVPGLTRGFRSVKSRKSLALSCNPNPSFLQLSCFEQLFEIATCDTTVKHAMSKEYESSTT